MARRFGQRTDRYLHRRGSWEESRRCLEVAQQATLPAALDGLQATLDHYLGGVAWDMGDLAEAYEPVRVLRELVRKGPRNGKDLARAALEGDWKALPVLARVLSAAGDHRLAVLRPLVPPDVIQAARERQDATDDGADCRQT